MTEFHPGRPPFPLLLLEQMIVDLDRVRHTLSTEFTSITKTFRRYICTSSRIVPEVYGEYPDGSPSRVKLALLFKRRKRLKRGFRRVGELRTLLRYLPQPLDHDGLYRRGELRNEATLLALQDKLALLNSAGKPLNRAALALTHSLRHHAVPRAVERLLPRLPPPWSGRRFLTFAHSVLDDAWGFSVRYSRRLEDARNLAKAYAQDPPTNSISLSFAWDKLDHSRHLRWRVKPDHGRITDLTDARLRDLQIPKPLRPSILQFERRRRALARDLRMFHDVLERLRKRSSAAIAHTEELITKARTLQVPYSTPRRTTG